MGQDGKVVTLQLRATELRRLAGRGEPWAQYELARRHLEGRGVECNAIMAAAWLTNAAHQGFVPAFVDLAMLRAYGHTRYSNLTQDVFEAIHWFEIARARDDSRGAFHLGILYVCGYGVDLNIEKGRRFLEEAAAAGHTDATRLLAEASGDARQFIPICARVLGSGEIPMYGLTSSFPVSPN